MNKKISQKRFENKLCLLMSFMYIDKSTLMLSYCTLNTYCKLALNPLSTIGLQVLG